MTVSKPDAVIKPDDAQTDADKKKVSPTCPKTHYAFEYIERLRGLGIVCGDENGKFNPDEKITRAEFVKLIVTALKR
ncbi:MAG: S-layer homology domain-containing protein [Clostridiales bacterium]|nr:MAG: S-layer homology domain-containing protein [Clostridiales bacterium]